MTTPDNVPDDRDVVDSGDAEQAFSGRRVSRLRQFSAVLHKNYLLQTRASRAWYYFGAAGWAALFIEIAIPAVFFALMCIPKHYFKPAHFPQQLAVPYDLDAMQWATEYEGPAKAREYRALLLYSPNTTNASAVMAAFARSVACPLDPAKKTSFSTSFYRLFRQTLPTQECSFSRASCLINGNCSRHLLGTQIVGYGTEEEALERARREADTVDAVITLQGLDRDNAAEVSYTLRVNHTEVPSTRGRLNLLDVRPDAQYKKYWLFANLQLHLDRALIGLALDRVRGLPALLDVGIKPFPWPESTFDAGAAAAAVAFNLLLVFAFLVPTRSMVATIVREKELRLREGMCILGLKDAAYWGSWTVSHFATLALSMLLCALTSLYPFRHSSFTLLLAVLWLVAAALVAFAYFLSTLFSKSRVAGIAAAMLYSLAMVPGYLMPTLQPYGGLGWYFSCLSPPSAVSLFANVLIKVEASGQGLQWDSLSLGVTSESSFPFSAKVVFLALIIDIVLYSLLTAYLDKVLPSDVGARLPWDFPFQKQFWLRESGKYKAAESQDSGAVFEMDSGPAVTMRDLRKVFMTTEGVPKAAVDGLTLNFWRGQITGLLGANGAGKTTTISILTGMISPTSGSAHVHGLSIQNQMDLIRQNLGVCPQFDILWPDITVREHLELYAAIKGYSSKAGRDAAISAAKDVGLETKLDSMAANLSGGQRRKLSVAIAFLGSPAVVILDEPTSGMDPYSRRFTWEIIKRHKEGHAIILTSHSMEEVDLMCDKIAIMAEGRLAASGTSMNLKQEFGVGYRLTIVKEREIVNGSPPNRQESRDVADACMPAAASQHSVSEDVETSSEVERLIKRHVQNAHLTSCGASEMVFRLPKEDSPRFPGLLRDLESAKADIGVSSYGLTETTLEEVFLAVTSQQEKHTTGSTRQEQSASDDLVLSMDTSLEGSPLLGDASDFQGDLRRPTRVQGARLYFQQLWALIVKRAISAKRDKLAVWTQLCVPILLVLVALLSGKATSNFPQEPAAPITREWCEFGAPTVFGASAEAKANATALHSFLRSYGEADVEVSQAEKLWSGPIFAPVEGTLDAYLLKRWGSKRASYDALFVQNWPDSLQVLATGQAVKFTVLVNQTAIHAIPAVLNSANRALLRAATDDMRANLSVTNHPLPTLSHESAIEVSRQSGDLLIVLFTIMASAVLSASFAVFLVRERESCSKHVQMICGAPISAFWLSTLLWDYLSFSLPAAGILICYAFFQLPQFQGPRLGALAVLLWSFGLASLPLTYLLHFAFDDEMKALSWINSLLLLSGYLGFIASWILDIVFLVTRKHGVHVANVITQRILRVVSPHFNLARGMYEVASTHTEAAEMPDASPWTWKATGQWVTFFAVQAVVFGGFTLMVDGGWFQAVGRRLHHLCSPCLSCMRLVSRRQPDIDDWVEDEDVARERYRIQDGRGEREGDQVLLSKLEKSYSQGFRQPLLRAVRDISVGIPKGECFGLLGVNGAGKTTTFRILTGEVAPDGGDASICGHSVTTELPAARRKLGYCPQFSALPGAMTGREVLRMYARLQGVPGGLIASTVRSLLERLDLMQYADRACDSYSGGNKRKLSVAIALVGEPPVVMLDEPSTGMDPGAKRFLWDIIQRQVVDRGHTVLLTSHSMEECEALCTKIAIMRAGALRCLGSVQHLKNRFGAGYVLAIRREPHQEHEPLQEALEEFCPEAELLHWTNGRSSWRLPQQGLNLSALFERIEVLKEALGIEEYSISQTTLEHVFVQLAQR